METYIINLARSTVRKKEMQKQLQNLGMPHRFIEAVDARTITQEHFDKIAPAPDTLKGEVACTLSHLKAYDELLKSGHRYGIIMEDDCIIQKDFNALINGIEEYLHPDQVTLLTYYWCREGKLRLRPNLQKGNYQLCTPQETWGVARAGAYIISAEVAERLLNYHGAVVKCSADNWIAYEKAGLISGLCCIHPEPCTENPKFSSEIDYVRGRIALRIKSLISNIPILRSIAEKRRKLIASSFKNIELY